MTGSQSQNCERFSRRPPSSGGRPQKATLPVGSMTALIAKVGRATVVVRPAADVVRGRAREAPLRRGDAARARAARAAACSAAWRGPSVAISYGVCADAGATASSASATASQPISELERVDPAPVVAIADRAVVAAHEHDLVAGAAQAAR